MKQNDTNMQKRTDIYISLISHTNVGKTSLARTLLREDIGEVRDKPHVTEKSEAYVMLESEDARLLLWDTPGFGDIRKILSRVKREGGATSWLLHHVVDRMRERPLFCSVEALKNIKKSADLIFYLVNAHENPVHAGYPALEMELLSYVNKKVIVVLNHISSLGRSPEDHTEEIRKWRDFVKPYSFVVGLYPLDAFQPLPDQEISVLRAVCLHLDSPDNEACYRLVESYIEGQKKTYRACRNAAWDVFHFALGQEETNRGKEQKDSEKAFSKMQKALAVQMSTFSHTLMVECRISLADQAVIKTELKDLQNRIEKLPEKKAGMMAGFVSGLISGLSADLVSGGLTFGGGAVLGGISGWLAAYYGTKGFNQVFRSSHENLRWSDPFLANMITTMAALYLRILHHGRARGVLYFSEEEETEFWLVKLEPMNEKILSLVGESRKAPDEENKKHHFDHAFDLCASKQAGIQSER